MNNTELLNQCLDGDSVSLELLQQKKNDSGYYEAFSTLLNEKNERLLIPTALEAIRFFDAKAEYQSKRIQELSGFDILHSIKEALFLDQISVLIFPANTESNYSIDYKVKNLITQLFKKTIDLGLDKLSLETLAEAEVFNLEGTIRPEGDNFLIVEKNELKNSIMVGFESFKNTLQLLSVKFITPRTVKIGTVAVSIGMSLSGHSAFASVHDIGGLIDSEKFTNIFEKMTEALTTVHGEHANLVKVLENVHTLGATGHGHFKIEVGDCSVVGDYNSETIDVHSVHASQEGPALCNEFADELGKTLLRLGFKMISGVDSEHVTAKEMLDF